MRCAAVVISALVLAGCGGDDEGPRLTKAQFSAEGKRICDTGAKRTTEVVEEELAKDEVQKMDETEQRLHTLEASRPIVDDTMDKLAGLEAPEDVEPHVKTLTSGVREVMEIFENPESIGEDELKRLQELTAETRTAARKAGLEACLPENTPT
jgi:hypothetical protein